MVLIIYIDIYIYISIEVHDFPTPPWICRDLHPAVKTWTAGPYIFFSSLPQKGGDMMGTNKYIPTDLWLGILGISIQSDIGDMVGDMVGDMITLH